MTVERQKQIIIGLIFNGSYDTAKKELDCLKQYHMTTGKPIMSETAIKDFYQAIKSAKL